MWFYLNQWIMIIILSAHNLDIAQFAITTFLSSYLWWSLTSRVLQHGILIFKGERIFSVIDFLNPRNLKTGLSSNSKKINLQIFTCFFFSKYKRYILSNKSQDRQPFVNSESVLPGCLGQSSDHNTINKSQILLCTKRRNNMKI